MNTIISLITGKYLLINLANPSTSINKETLPTPSLSDILNSSSLYQEIDCVQIVTLIICSGRNSFNLISFVNF